MDPTPLANYQWSEIDKLLTNIWWMVVLVIVFATNWIIGHMLGPSLVGSHHIPRAAQKLRPMFYGLAVASFGLGVYVLSEVVQLAQVLRLIWEDFWI